MRMNEHNCIIQFDKITNDLMTNGLTNIVILAANPNFNGKVLTYFLFGIKKIEIIK